jgi:hypothetical protein
VQYWDGGTRTWGTIFVAQSTTLGAVDAQGNTPWTLNNAPTHNANGDLSNSYRYYALAYAYDGGSNRTTSSLKTFLVNADTVAPDLSQITTPAGASALVSPNASLILSGKAHDDLGIGKVTISLYRRLLGTTGAVQYWNGATGTWGPTSVAQSTTLGALDGDGNTSWSLTSPPTNNANGDLSSAYRYYALAYAYDAASNRTVSALKTFLINPDAEVPVLCVIDTPTGGAELDADGLSGSLNSTGITGRARDNAGGLGIASVKVRLGRRASNAPKTAPYQFWNGVDDWANKSTLLGSSLRAGTGADSANTVWETTTGLPSSLEAGYSYQALAYAYDKNNNLLKSAPVLFTSNGQRSGSVNAPASANGLSSAAASAASSTVTLIFDRPLNVASASDASHYVVSINGAVATIQSASYNAASSSVTLSLAEGTVTAGDVIGARWNLQSASGTNLIGKTSIKAK